VLQDGSWHGIEDLRAVTRFPAEWVNELSADGVVDASYDSGNLLVRLAPADPDPRD
jgi:hypothetical protein